MRGRGGTVPSPEFPPAVLAAPKRSRGISGSARAGGPHSVASPFAALLLMPRIRLFFHFGIPSRGSNDLSKTEKSAGQGRNWAARLNLPFD
jgi:hypothetical protein